jgi:hypothetical protein
MHFLKMIGFGQASAKTCPSLSSLEPSGNPVDDHPMPLTSIEGLLRSVRAVDD